MITLMTFNKYRMAQNSLDTVVLVLNIEGQVTFVPLCRIEGHAVAQLVEAQRYKSEGRWFDSGCCHRNFSLT
jgi:hypothetical protein